MAKTDWRMGDVVHPEDMNEIGEEVNQLREDLDHIDIPPASTSITLDEWLHKPLLIVALYAEIYTVMAQA